MEYDNLFDLIEHLDRERREGLMATCHELKLSVAAIEGVEQAARLLKRFEDFQKPFLPTVRESHKNLREIEKLATDLASAIGVAGNRNKLRMHQHMEGMSMGAWTWPSHVPLSGVVDYLAIALGHLALAAQAVLTESASDGKKGGRNHLHHHYFFFFDWLSDSIEDEGISIGRGGDFHRLCDAMFAAAGVPATADGALKFYLEHRPRVEAERALWRAEVDLSASQSESTAVMKRAKFLPMPSVFAEGDRRTVRISRRYTKEQPRRWRKRSPNRPS